MTDSSELENFKILRSIWKNTADKMLEIKVTNNRSWNESKKQILEEEKKKIDGRYDKEYNDQFIENKIQISDSRNNSNLNKMRKRNELMESISMETLQKIKSFAKPENEKYRTLMKKLIIQSMIKLLEPICYVQVRKIDIDFVKKIIKECEDEYTKLMNKETGKEYKCVLEVDEHTYLDNER